MVVIWVREIESMDKERKNKDGREEEVVRKDDDIFEVEEVILEEMAIDGICGVY